MFRTDETKKRKQAYDETAATTEHFSDWESRLVKPYRNWIIINNNFPYDLIAEIHHLLIPRRVFPHYEDMSDEEEEELFKIKREIAPDYDSILENFADNRSVHNHFHFHLLKFKPEYK